MPRTQQCLDVLDRCGKIERRSQLRVAALVALLPKHRRLTLSSPPA